MQRETKFKNRVKPRLDEIPKSFFIKIQLKALRGIPDYIGCVNGRFVALELKNEDTTTDSLQGWTLRKLRAAGAYTCVVKPSNLDKVVEDLKKLAS